MDTLTRLQVGRSRKNTLISVRGKGLTSLFSITSRISIINNFNVRHPLCVTFICEK
jgi:hypothetical protein